jgi:hypothetical protein
MKISAQPAYAALLVVFLFSACDQAVKEEPPQASEKQPVDQSDPFAAIDDEDTSAQSVPATLDDALDLMMEGLTDEDRKLVEEAGEDYATMAHFGGGMGMRNSWGLWADSSLSRYFAWLGIYHADDMSAIINTAFSRRVRGKEIKLEELVKYYRDYWAKEDTVAPLDIKCPSCREEMLTHFDGEGLSQAHPEKKYFRGNCYNEGKAFAYYHKDGWRTYESVQSEQASAGQPATRPESDFQGGDKPQPEAEGRSR